MPLECDCYDGCWGNHSKDWPEVDYSGTQRRPSQVEGFVHGAVPYGSYVFVANFTVRIETEDLAAKVRRYAGVR